VPVVTVNASEGPAFGAALMGGVCSGMFSDLADASDALVKIVSVAVPIPSNVSRYEEWYERYRALYPALKQEFANVATMVEKHSQ